MCIISMGGGSSAPPPAPAPAPAVVMPDDTQALEARDIERRRRAMMKGRRSTLLAGASSAQPAQTQAKTLLGA